MKEETKTNVEETSEKIIRMMEGLGYSLKLDEIFRNMKDKEGEEPKLEALVEILVKFDLWVTEATCHGAVGSCLRMLEDEYIDRLLTAVLSGVFLADLKEKIPMANNPLEITNPSEMKMFCDNISDSINRTKIIISNAIFNSSEDEKPH